MISEKTYIATKVENGFLFICDGKTYVFNNVDAVAKDLASGVFGKMSNGETIEFSAKVKDNGTEDHN